MSFSIGVKDFLTMAADQPHVKRILTKRKVRKLTQERLTIEQNMNIILVMFGMEGEMIRTILEEAAALVSIALFVGMIAVWAGMLSSGW
jgi:hypothetical protein